MRECPTVHADATDPQLHPAVRAWVALGAGHGEPERITTLKAQEGKSAVYRLEGVGHSGDAVIAKRCRWSVAVVESVLYEQVLPNLPLPRLGFYGFVGEPAREFAWLFVEDAGEQRLDPLDKQQRCLAAQWLALLHTSARGLVDKVELPDRSPTFYRGQARAVRQAIDQSVDNTALQPDDRSVLAAVTRQLTLIDERWDHVEAACAGLQRTLVHGDFVRKNVRLRMTADGVELFALDWETAGWGVPAIDLCRFVGGPVKPDLTAYYMAMRDWQMSVTMDQIEALADVGSIFRLISAMSWAALRLDQPWVSKCMVWMSCYRTYMVEALRATPWGQGVQD